MISNNLNENIFGSETKTQITDSIRLIFKYWYTKCRVYYKCHKEASDHYNKINKYIGIPTILVGIFNTTTIFSNYTTQNQQLMLVNGTASFIATILSSMQNYFELGKLITTHAKLANGYSKITSTIEKILMYEKLTNKTEINSKIIENIINQMEFLSEDAPYVPDKIWNKYKSEIKSIISIIISNQSIKEDIDIIASRNNSVNQNSTVDDKESIDGKDNEHNVIDVFDNTKKP